MVYQLKNVSKGYRDGISTRWVLSNFNHQFRRNRITTIWGPSGSGKTTLLNLLAGLAVCDTGEVSYSIDGETAILNRISSRERLEFRKANVGFVYQFYNLIPTLTIRENVELPLELTKRWHLRDAALAHLDSLGLTDQLDAFPNSLSGGEQQRVAIARALAHQPSVLLADEPTGNLDHNNATSVINLLCDAVQKSNTTLIVATHDENVRARSDEVLELFG